MIRNSKPKVRQINDEQAKELNNMGFYVRGLGNVKEINKDTTYFLKNYNCCGQTFTLAIDIESEYLFCGEKCGNIVSIQTPASSFSDSWSLQDFSKSMEDFQKALKEDLKKLRKLGIIS